MTTTVFTRPPHRSATLFAVLSIIVAARTAEARAGAAVAAASVGGAKRGTPFQTKLFSVGLPSGRLVGRSLAPRRDMTIIKE